MVDQVTNFFWRNNENPFAKERRPLARLKLDSVDSKLISLNERKGEGKTHTQCETFFWYPTILKTLSHCWKSVELNKKRLRREIGWERERGGVFIIQSILFSLIIYSVLCFGVLVVFKKSTYTKERSLHKTKSLVHFFYWNATYSFNALNVLFSVIVNLENLTINFLFHLNKYRMESWL